MLPEMAIYGHAVAKFKNGNRKHVKRHCEWVWLCLTQETKDWGQGSGNVRVR